MIENHQNVSVEDIEVWLKELEDKGELYISSIENFAPDSKIYQNLKSRGTDSFAVVPLIVNGSIAGFLGVDDPRCNVGHFLPLSVIASACCNEIVNKRLENSNKALTERMKIIQSMSEIYTSAYYIDISKNHYTELSSLGAVHGHIGSSGDAQERLNYFCRHMMIPECTEELLRFVDLSTMDERMGDARIVSKQYQSALFFSPEKGGTANWSQCSFIEGDRDVAGKLAHII